MVAALARRVMDGEGENPDGGIESRASVVALCVLLYEEIEGAIGEGVSRC